MLVRKFVRAVGAACMVSAICAGASGVALAQSPVPSTSPIQRMQAPSQSPVSVPVQPALPMEPSRMPDAVVPVSSVSIEGATVFPSADVEGLTSGLVGKTTKLRQIDDARLAIVRKYRSGGYPLVAVDVDLRKSGLVRFVVSEGRIAEVRVEGDIGSAGEKVRGFLENLLQERPVSALRMERWILMAQDVPGVTLQTLLSPSDVEPGAMVLTARVRRQVVSAAVSMDNRAYKLSGPDEVLATVNLNSLSQFGERTELSLFRSMFQPAEIFGQAAVEGFIGNSGLKLRVYGGAGHSTPRGDLAHAGFDGVTTVFGAAVSYPLIKQRRQVLNLSGNFDANESDILTGKPAARSSYDSVRTLRFGADYVLADTWISTAYPAVNTAMVKVSRGLSALGASTNGQALSGRQGSRYDFTKMNAEISRDQTLFQPWTDSSVTFYALAAGQASGSVLPPSEKFEQGGMRFTRGFYAGEVTGDNAIALTGELRLNTRFSVPAFGQVLDTAAQFYTFYDWGQTMENQAVDPNRRLVSYGLGVRMSLTDRTEFGLEGVRRETRVVNSSSTLKPLSADALYWRVVVKY